MSELADTSNLANALAMTGCKDEEDLIDMANVGKSLMNAIDTFIKAPSLIEGWSPADDPAEIVGDLYNLFEESINCHKADLDRLKAAEAALAAEEVRSKELLGRIDKAREGKEPDFCYDPDEWEFTCDWSERDQVHGHGDAFHHVKVMQVATLVRGPRKWVAPVPSSWDEDGAPADTEIRWFDSEEAALAAIAATPSGGARA